MLIGTVTFFVAAATACADTNSNSKLNQDRSIRRSQKQALFRFDCKRNSLGKIATYIDLQSVLANRESFVGLDKAKLPWAMLPGEVKLGLIDFEIRRCSFAHVFSNPNATKLGT